ncbi:ZIP family metal transporter [Metabacillus sp. GX 13764]|uniref:ZIP family metal transporter n=1 Tax=Metabacillus kandeliae TaxID=2900151 RepID=UPI001E2C016D|nr:ZIP family metal transporter [Metabacillus kandeliae]MCD7036302.1 ZIP family metal transporter [Metabacillus kandeliae]
MFQAAGWGAFAGSSIFIGALMALFLKIPTRVIGWIMSFGTGVLIGAASFDLLGDSVESGGLLPSALGFLGGALLFTVSEYFISKSGGKHRKRSGAKDSSQNQDQNQSGIGIFIGTLIDAIPESIIIGVSLLQGQGVSVLMVAAVLISNFPEGLSSTVGLRKAGHSRKTVFILWIIVTVIAAVSSLLGFALFASASPALLAVISSFAAGGIIAMVAATMMPEAFEEGGPIVGMISSLGLLVSLILSQLE